MPTTDKKVRMALAETRDPQRAAQFAADGMKLTLADLPAGTPVARRAGGFPHGRDGAKAKAAAYANDGGQEERWRRQLASR
jgi:hypothetical protein